jgi:PAS domain S-box-containing protein
MSPNDDLLRPKAAAGVDDGDVNLHLFRALLEHTPDSVYFKDLESRFIRISARQAERYGLSDAADAVGKTDADFFAPEHALAALRDEQQIIQTGQPIVGKEERQAWPDGRRTWVSTNKLPLRDDAGRVIGTFGISRDITKRVQAEQALRASEENLREALAAMERELDRARIIQRALLAPAPPNHALADVAVHYEPLNAIGGDYYAAHPLVNGGLGVFIGDVMGHGVSAALFMALLKFISDRLFAEHGLEPKPFLEELNMTLMDQMPMSFATGLYGVFQREERETSLLMAGAGHPAPILQRAATGDVELLPMTGNAALGLTDQFATEAARVALGAGDRIYFYTDGVTEASNENDDMLGNERLLELARRSMRPGLSDTLKAIIGGLNDFRGSAPLDDDILLVGIQVK